MNVRDEKGQAIVLTVAFLAVMLGMAALVLDVGSWFHEKRQLQASADAAALAGAQALPSDPSTAGVLAQTYADKNGGGLDSVSVTGSQTSNDTINVTMKKSAPGFFSKVFGIAAVGVGASAKARVEAPAQARYVAPMVVSKYHPLLAGSGCPCFGQSTTLKFDALGAPGAFGMLNLDGGNGTVGTSSETLWIDKGFDKYLPLGQYRSDPGAKFSSSQVQGALSNRIGTVLLFPVFDTLNGSGQTAEYQIIGWVGFLLTDYKVKGNNATLNGSFTEFIAQGIQSTTGSPPPNFGARSVQLIG